MIPLSSAIRLFDIGFHASDHITANEGHCIIHVFLYKILIDLLRQVLSLSGGKLASGHHK